MDPSVRGDSGGDLDVWGDSDGRGDSDVDPNLMGIYFSPWVFINYTMWPLS